MWKKEEVPTSTPVPPQDTIARPDRPAPASAPAERATIGRSITIRGEVTGDEDLLIQGRVDGSVDLKQHSVTVGAEGDVKASIAGRVVMIEGRVEGNIIAEEQVILRSSARVQGDIAAPRVVLEDGARFRGGVDMGEVGDRGRPGVGGSSAQARRGSDSGRTAPALVDSSSDKAKSPSDATVEAAT